MFRVAERDGDVVIEVDGPIEVLTVEQTLAAIDAVRADRGRLPE